MDEQTDKEFEAFQRAMKPSFLVRILDWFNLEIFVTVVVAMFFMGGGFVWLASTMPAGPSEREHAVRILRRHGYTAVETQELGLFQCGESYTRDRSIGFRARTSAGYFVEGAVCCGWVKSCTIRFE